MTKPKPLTEWQQQTTPGGLPRHIRRNIRPGEGDCWLWSRSLSPDGYGWASFNDKTHQAHRLIYRLTVGEIQDGLVLDHLCRIRHCVNPAHLEPVTPRENLRRGDTPTAWESCRRCGSEFTWNGWQRRCVPCASGYEKSRRKSSA